ncbi:GntR family transcriptional regulator [Castellaniella ginsengisoli]|uniref:GntR family transcriptional regulator n=1 Tax=Castellaniella ginsengisoli TaxID=546114 RepID=A0AB39E4L2_9BURK
MGLYDDIRSDLLAGRWEWGQRLPSIRAMAAQRRVSLHTVVSTYGRLVGDGLLEAQQGRGYFVAVQGLHRPAAPAEAPVLPGDPLFRLLQAPPGRHVKLGCGWLPPSWRDTDLLARAIRRTGSSPHWARPRRWTWWPGNCSRPGTGCWSMSRATATWCG